MHLGHRRSNSYSTTAAGSPEPFVLQPPPVLANRLNPAASNFVSSQKFVRSTEERRSFSNHTDALNSPRLSTRPYRGVAISRATPATVRFSVTPELDWFFDMSRPRSPSKAWRPSPADSGVPALDQTLNAIKEQLVG